MEKDNKSNTLDPSFKNAQIINLDIKIKYKGLQMKQILYVLVFITTLLSCSETVINSQYTVLPLTEKDNVKVDSKNCFTLTSIIPLKETTGFHIRAIKKLVKANNEYYILCNNSKDILVVFNKTGDKIREIGQWGNGHGEHGQINDFCVDKKNQRVLMLCENSRIIVYSLSGNYISEKRISQSSFGNIESLNGFILCTTNHQTFTEGQNAFLFYVFDEKLNLVTKHTHVLPDYMSMFSLLTSPLKVIDNNYVYSDFYTHRIYLLDSVGEIVQTYSYEEKKLMPSELFKEYNLFTKNQFKYDFILDNVVMKDTILTIYKDGDQIRLNLNNRRNGEIKDFPIKGVIPKLYGIDGKNILSVNTVGELKKMGIDNHGKIPDAYFFLTKYKIDIK